MLSLITQVNLTKNPRSELLIRQKDLQDEIISCRKYPLQTPETRRWDHFQTRQSIQELREIKILLLIFPD